MKSLISILFLFLTSLNVIILPQNPGWFEQQSGTTEDLNACSFVGQNLGIAVGFNGLILRTTDAGTNWLSVTNNTNENLFGVKMVSYVVGWIVGENGTILKTTDSGLNWFSQVSPSQEFFSACYFQDENSGWIVGNNGVLLRTSNGGGNWNVFPIGTSSFLNDIFFISSDRGWISGGDELLRTTDSGLTWNVIYQHSLKKVFFIDDSIGWAINEGPTFNTSVVYTSNGGFNWDTKLSSSSSGTAYRAIYFVDEEKGWTVGEDGLILMTSDAGENWVDQSVNINNYYFLDVEFDDSEVGWTVGQNGKIFKTTNGGVSFIKENKLNQIPTSFSLEQNYPNPFNPSTTINFSILSTTFTNLSVYDLTGKLIETLISKEMPTGKYEITWTCGDLSSGIYFYRIQTPEYSSSKKMLFLK